MEALKVSRQVDNWNDDRIDELAGGMNDRFDKVDGRFEKVEGEMKDGFDRVDARFEKVEGEMNDRFDKVDGRFEKVEGEMKEGFAAVDARFDKVDERLEKADQTSSAMRERMTRIETKLEGLATLERLVWGFGSALLIAVVGPRFF